MPLVNGPTILLLLQDVNLESTFNFFLLLILCKRSVFKLYELYLQRTVCMNLHLSCLYGCSLWVLITIILFLLHLFIPMCLGICCPYQRMHPTKVKVLACVMDTVELLPLQGYGISCLAAAKVGNALGSKELPHSKLHHFLRRMTGWCKDLTAFLNVGQCWRVIQLQRAPYSQLRPQLLLHRSWTNPAFWLVWRSSLPHMSISQEPPSIQLL